MIEADDLSPNGMSDCWLWGGYIDTAGYGRFRLNNPRRQIGAHRQAYEMVIGPVPDGLVLDHLCRRTSCVNPAHLEPVTHRTNVLRGVAGDHERTKTHCPHGHEYTPSNTYGRPDGQRRCKTCVLAVNNANHAKRRALKNAKENTQ
ncbi:MAG TPA: HNH endonuclease signature motif containing protein [Polyangia bacterium]|nr:HNH endonuclease signature motif containing protein [Polyangia bacterium]